ncbi:MAG: nucleotidyltransferase substrate binding protein [Thermoguttaceae bacterium]
MSTYRERWEERFEHFENAWQVFCRLERRYRESPTDEACCMALVQAFEFTYELAWKTMKDYLESESFHDLGGSKQTVRAAFQNGLIDDSEAWMDAIKKRNLTTHVYNQSIFDEAVAYITETFFPLASKLFATLKQKQCPPD